MNGTFDWDSIENEVKKLCPHAAECGGCSYQTLPYEEQLKLKETQVKKLMAEIFEKQKEQKYSNKKIARVEKETYHFFSELFESAVIDKRKIRLMYKTKLILDCVSLKIV